MKAEPAQSPAQPVRIGRKLGIALDAIAIQGKSVKDAALIANMNASALSRALSRPGIREILEQRKAQYCLDADQLKGVAKALAMRVGMELLQTSKSDAVKARLVEFFAGEARQAAVNVQINNAAPVGYAYRRPDSPSDAIDGQALEIKGNGKAVE